MAHRHLKPLAATLLLVLSLGFLAGAGPARTAHPIGAFADSYGGGPSGMRPSPATAVPNQQVDITVTMSGVVSEDQSVQVSVSDPNAFSGFPAYVIVPAGSDHAVFSVIVRSGASPEGLTLSATANGTTVTSPMAIGAQTAG